MSIAMAIQGHLDARRQPQAFVGIDEVASVSEAKRLVLQEKLGPEILTAPLEPIILETADKYRNVKHRKNQDKRIRDRAKKFFQENELEEMIEKVGEKKARQLGWITKDGKKNKE